MKRGQRGFTLIEVLISIAVMGAIVGALSTATINVLTHHKSSTNQNLVLDQVQNAGYWISRDVQAAEVIDYSESGGFPLSLDIPLDTDPINDYTVSYIIDGDNLIRQVNDSAGTLIGEYIDVDNTTFSTSSEDTDTYILNISATRDGFNVTRSYVMTQRIGSL